MNLKDFNDDSLGPVNSIDDLRPIGSKFLTHSLARDRWDTDPTDHYYTWEVTGYAICARGLWDKWGIWQETVKMIDIRYEYPELYDL